MSKCLKCDIEVNSVSNKCPLCNFTIDVISSPIYPKLKKSANSAIARKIVLFVIVLSSIIVGVVNYIFTPDVKWSIFVIAQLLIAYLIFRKLLKGFNKYLSAIFICSLFIYSISFFWDYYTGLKGWSINYVLPSLSISYAIFIFIFRVIKYIKFHSNSNFIYLNLLLCFIPLILLFLNQIDYPLLTIISGCLALVNLLVIIVFDWKSFKNDIEKNLYI